ncbi:hypothetical protein MASR2M79_12930 [Aminivibrio sp.]
MIEKEEHHGACLWQSGFELRKLQHGHVPDPAGYPLVVYRPADL